MFINKHNITTEIKRENATKIIMLTNYFIKKKNNSSVITSFFNHMIKKKETNSYSFLTG